MTVPLGKRIKRSVRSALLRAIVRLLARVPLRPAFAFATLVGRAAWPLARGTRRLMLEHLAVAFPERSPEERETIARATFVHLARVAAEIATLPRWRARLEEYVRLTPGAEALLDGLVAKGRGVIFVGGHLGNWELMAQRVAARWPSSAIARAGNDPKLNRLVAEARLEGGMELLWREDPSTARAMIRSFRRGKVLGLLIDQDTKVQGVFVPFFGRPAFTPRGAADLALRFQPPVVVGWCRRRGPGPDDGHELDAVEVPYDAEAPDKEAEVLRLTAALTAKLEAVIRERPAEWVWMHERWKTRPGPTEGAQANTMPKSPGLSGE